MALFSEYIVCIFTSFYEIVPDIQCSFKQEPLSKVQNVTNSKMKYLKCNISFICSLTGHDFSNKKNKHFSAG